MSSLRTIFFAAMAAVALVRPAAADVIYLSSAFSGTVSGIAFSNEDILAYDTDTQQWAMFFDGSDVGLQGTNVGAFHIENDSSILLSVGGSVAGVGPVRRRDIVQFFPTATGDSTSGSFSLLLEGSAVGLDSKFGVHRIDAIARAPDGRLVVSLQGNGRVPGAAGNFNFKSNDLLVFNGTLAGMNSSGAWELYFDGSEVDLERGGENIIGTWIDGSSDEIYLTTKKDFSAGGISGDNTDIFICDPGLMPSLPVISCNYTLYFDGSAVGFNGRRVDGIHIENAAPPLAVADPDYVATSEVLLSVPAATGVLANDTLGTPPATVAFFGGGSLGGSVTDNAAGATAPFGTGSLTVNTNGSFDFTSDTGDAGSFTFEYRIDNGAGASDALVTIQVNPPPAPPTAVKDPDPDIPATSMPGDTHHIALNGNLSLSDGSGGLMDNDDRGFPLAAVITFGPTGVETPAGNTGGTTQGGSVTVQADGGFSYTPANNFVGLDNFVYTIQNTQGSSAATVTVAVGERPAATNDTFPDTIIGNVSIDTTASSNFSVLSNDAGDGLTASLNTANNGDVTVNADGTFTYDPDPGFEGADSFTYDISNGFGTDTGTVSLAVSGMIWFIDASAAGGGDGRLNSPFNCLVSASCFSSAAHDPGDNIFLFSGSYTDGITLLNNQILIGQGAGATIETITGLTPPADSSLPATGGSSPTLANSGGNAIDLATGNTIRGLDIGNTSGTGINGTDVGTLVVRDVNISTPGGGVDLRSASGSAIDVVLDSLSASSSTDEGILLNGVSGSFAVNGSSNTISATGLRAVDITGAADPNEIALGITLRSVSANGGANGIQISNTTGSFTVTGDGSETQNGSGGAIQNTTDNGISLTNAGNISLIQLNIVGAGNSDDENSIHIRNLFGASLIEDVRLDDINEFGIDVRNTTTDDATTDTLTIRRLSVEDHTNAGFGESGILGESQGTSNLTLNIEDSTFELNNNGALGVLVNSLGTSTLDLTIDNNIFNAVNAFGSGAIQVINGENSNATVTVTNNDINESEFISIVVNNDDDATSAVTISGNDIDADATAAGVTDYGISVRQDENGTMTVLIDNNTFADIGDVAIFGQARDTTDGTGTLNITVTNNDNGAPVFSPAPGLVVRADDTNTVNANITGNDFTGNGVQDIVLRNDAAFNLTQTSAANLSSVNNGDSVLLIQNNAINFGAPAPPLP